MVVSERIFTDNNLRHYFDEIKKYKLLTYEDEKQLAQEIEKGDKNAFNTMVKSNLRLVINIAKHYISSGWGLPDLIQEGNLGLIRAVEKYDFRKNVRFSTYASWWIKQAITRSLSNKKRMIRLPHRKEEKLRKINRTIVEMSQELNNEPSMNQVAKRLKYNEIDILNLKIVSEKIMSIDAEINDNGHSISDLIDDKKTSPEYVYNKIDMKKQTEKMLGTLKQKERDVIKSRYAFDTSKKQTLESIGKDLGLSAETVRQIELKAIKKIKENYSYLKDYLFC